MKHIILALSVNLLFCNYTVAQEQNEILLTGVHGCYYNNETIIFYVKNTNIYTKFYILVGVQKKIKNEWVTVLRDIERTSFTKTDHIIILDSNAVKVSWTPMNSPQFGKKENVKGEFRFIFSFGLIPSDLKNVEYGSAFYIK